MNATSTMMKTESAGRKVLLCLPLAVWLVAAQAQPSITSQPTNQTVQAGSNAAFSVTVSDAGPVTYLWQFNGSNVLNQLITIAGKNTNSYSGDNGPATNATLNGPRGVCADALGNVYIADSVNQRVRKVGTNGIITTIAGNGAAGFSGNGGQATSATLNNPYGVALDPLGRLYIADSANNRIRLVNTNGVISTFAGNGTAGYSGDNAAATNAELYGPNHVALDVSNNLYIADEGNGRIRKVAANGIITSVASGLSNAIGVAVGTAGQVYIAESYLNQFLTNSRVQLEYEGFVQNFAGNGTAGFSGDGGMATLAQLSLPQDVAVLSNDTCYIADSANNRIRQVTSNGVISTVAGNGVAGTAGDGSVATNASLYKPLGLGLDPFGNLYIADQFNGRIREMSPLATKSNLTLNAVPLAEAGNYTVIVSDATGSVTSSVAVLAVYTLPAITTQPVNQSVLAGNNAAFSVSATGTAPLSYDWFFEGANMVQSGSSNILAIEDAGTNNAGSYAVVVSSPYGAVTSQVAILTVGFAPSIITQPASELVWPHSNALFTVVASGTGPLSYHWQLNGANLTENTIETMAGSGVSGFTTNSGPATNAALDFPKGVVADAAGNVYIADSGNNRVEEVNANGLISTIAGGLGGADTGDGGPAVDARVLSPRAVAFDAIGNLYIGDENRVRKVDAGGIITTAAGTNAAGYAGDGGPAINAELNNISAVTCDRAGNLYIADAYNSCVRQVNVGGIITTIAGYGVAGFNGDNIIATNAQLSNPTGVAVDALGNIYISDSGTGRIRKIGTNGIITTIAGNGGVGYSGEGIPATNASLPSPMGLSFDASGNLYVVDSCRIRKITTNGIISTVAGTNNCAFAGDGHAASSAELNDPQAIAFDTAGNLYIADTYNSRIREVLFGGQPTFSLTNVTAANAGNYTVVISNAFGSVTSSVAALELIVQPDIGGIAVQADGSVAINFTGTAGASHVLLMTTNLSPPVVWTPISTNLTAANGAGQLIDTNAQGAPARFYCVALP
jgi:sugar lactone lactonase YvrE